MWAYILFFITCIWLLFRYRFHLAFKSAPVRNAVKIVALQNAGRQDENINKAVWDLNDSTFPKLRLPVDAMDGVQNTRCLLKFYFLHPVWILHNVW